MQNYQKVYILIENKKFRRRKKVIMSVPDMDFDLFDLKQKACDYLGIEEPETQLMGYGIMQEDIVIIGRGETYEFTQS